ncbi:MAG: hypothetical protein ACHBNF_16545 [Chromatiales bacterium]
MWPFRRRHVQQASRTRRSDAIVDSRLHAKHDLGRADLCNADFFAQPANRAHFGSQLLLYEQVIIPTNDFAIVPALLQWMGQKHFEAALDCGAISFLRRLGLLGYAGNGNGISSFIVKDTTDKPFLWWQKALFGELAEAVELQLVHNVPSLTKRERDSLLQHVVAHSQPVTYDNDFFLKNIVQESYADIRDTPKLATYVTQLVARASHPLGQPIALERLAGVAPDALQLAGDGEVLSAADLVVRVAETNMEIVLADFAGGADLHVPMGADAILRHKLLRSGSTAVALEGFARLLELNGIPDIRVAVESGAISLPEIWKLRQRRVARRFREWLADAASSRDVERLYVESLGRTSLVQSLPARVVRFALTTAVGAANPVAGVAVSVIDSFFVDKYLAGYRPKLMLDEIRKLLPPSA